VRRVQADAVTVAGGAVGVLLLVLGLVSLARTGIPSGTLLEPVTSVGPFTRTPLMAIVELVLGVVVIGASATADRRSLTAIGLVSLVIGLVWVIEPGAFQTALGVGRESAMLYLVIGATCLAAGLLRLGGPVRERRIDARR
jgi:general stress protein CsbA